MRWPRPLRTWHLFRGERYIGDFPAPDPSLLIEAGMTAHAGWVERRGGVDRTQAASVSTTRSSLTIVPHVAGEGEIGEWFRLFRQGEGRR